MMWRASILWVVEFEIGEVAAAHVDGADAEPDVSIVDPVEVDQAFERRSQRRNVVETQRVRFLWRPKVQRRKARGEERRRPEHRDPERVDLVDEAVRRLVLEVERTGVGDAEDAKRRSADRLPELAQPLDPLFRRVAGDERRIHGADRDSGDPVRQDVRSGKRLVHPALIGAERSPALEKQSDRLEGRRTGFAAIHRLARRLGRHGTLQMAARAALQARRRPSGATGGRAQGHANDNKPRRTGPGCGEAARAALGSLFVLDHVAVGFIRASARRRGRACSPSGGLNNMPIQMNLQSQREKI